MYSDTSSAKGAPLGSPFVESFKIKLASLGTIKDLTLYELKGHFVECSLDQQCSRFIQQRLEEANDEEKQALFNEVNDLTCPVTNTKESHKLMNDVFGNYVIQKMFEFGNLN